LIGLCEALRGKNLLKDLCLRVDEFKGHRFGIGDHWDLWHNGISGPTDELEGVALMQVTSVLFVPILLHFVHLVFDVILQLVH
jgi:hypothetical protein